MSSHVEYVITLDPYMNPVKNIRYRNSRLLSTPESPDRLLGVRGFGSSKKFSIAEGSPSKTEAESLREGDERYQRIKKIFNNVDPMQIQNVLSKARARRNEKDLELLRVGLMNHNFFQKMKRQIHQELYMKLFEEIEFEEFEQFETIFEFGDKGDKFFIILDGEVFILIPKNQLIGEKILQQKEYQQSSSSIQEDFTRRQQFQQQERIKNELTQLKEILEEKPLVNYESQKQMKSEDIITKIKLKLLASESTTDQPLADKDEIQIAFSPPQRDSPQQQSPAKSLSFAERHALTLNTHVGQAQRMSTLEQSPTSLITPQGRYNISVIHEEKLGHARELHTPADKAQSQYTVFQNQI